MWYVRFCMYGFACMLMCMQVCKARTWPGASALIVWFWLNHQYTHECSHPQSIGTTTCTYLINVGKEINTRALVHKSVIHFLYLFPCVETWENLHWALERLRHIILCGLGCTHVCFWFGWFSPLEHAGGHGCLWHIPYPFPQVCPSIRWIHTQSSVSRQTSRQCYPHTQEVCCQEYSAEERGRWK